MDVLDPLWNSLACPTRRRPAGGMDLVALSLVSLADPHLRLQPFNASIFIPFKP